MEHVQRRQGGRYVYRRRVPAPLVPVIGKREVTKALGTSNPDEAKRLARKLTVELDEYWHTLISASATTKSAPQSGANFLSHEEHGVPDAKDITYTPEETTAQTVQSAMNWTEFRVAAMLSAITGGADIKKYTQAAQEAVQAVVAHTPSHLAPVDLTSGAEAVTRPGTATLADALRVWQEARTPDLATVDKVATIVAQFEGVHGRLPLVKITADHGRRWRDDLAKTAAPNTVRGKLGLLKAVLAAAVDGGLLDANPLRDIKANTAAKGKTATKARVPFSDAEAGRLLANLPTGEGMADTWRYVTLIAAYTAARVEEIAQIAPGDVRQENYRDADGTQRTTWVLYLTDKGEGQGLKNATSRRRVPLHADLIDAGFIDLVKASSGKARVFDQLRADKYGREGGAVSDWFGRYKHKQKIDNPRKTFHSWRHYGKDVLREQGVTEPVADALTGHTTGSIARGYGGEYYPLRPLVEASARLGDAIGRVWREA
ncbi:DUF6538 domain-containing protein, partial [Paraburkholderia mimosarum]|uniref:DUF6538 domain-containing protein n=1 Tax=Paraburkholderia mimosarum TaxID=312026 RepID=UPI0039C0BACD